MIDHLWNTGMEEILANEKALEAELSKVRETRESFMENHNRRMNELQRAIDSLNATMNNSMTESDEARQRQDERDLDELLRSLEDL